MKILVKLTRDENIAHYQAEEVEIDIEEYLTGVVGAEIGNSSLEACRAQAVASRTFALRKLKSQGFITDKSSSDQAFRISKATANYSNALQAVKDTQGEVLYYNNNLINNAYFSASNGGRIKSSQERWGGVRPYLISKEDPYDTGSGNGHGVGMSQNGAKHMAAEGFTYKEILLFYYPGVEIRGNYGEVSIMSTGAQAVINYAKSKIGCGYIYGTIGQKCTEGLIQQQANQYPDYVDYDVVKKWIGKEVFDCAGFVRKCMAQAGISMVSGATSQWNKTNWEQKGTIDTLPRDKVCCLYRYRDGKMQHTGIYLGDGTFVDARGSKQGVIGPSPLDSYPWTHWGIPAGLEHNNNNNVEVIKVLYKATVTASSGSTVNLREEPSSAGARIGKVAIGQEVDVLEETNIAWSKIMWNNKVGYMMSTYLQKNEETTKEGGDWYVRIKCSNQAEANALAKLLNSATVAN